MKIFIIGFGRMGQRHYEVINNTIVGSTITIFDVNQGSPPAYQNIKILDPNDILKNLSEIQPDLVIIATTASSHFSYLQMSVKAGVKNILCEKPLCVSLKECEDLEQLSKDNPETRIAVNHQMRFMEQYTRIKKMIYTDGFGPLRSISVQAGNFGAAMNGTHYFEMFRFLTDSPPAKIDAWLTPQDGENPRGKMFQDVAGAIRIENTNGQRFYMDMSQDQGHGIFVTYSCLHGQIHVDELAGRVYSSKRKNSEDMALPTTRYGMPSICSNITIEPADAIAPTARVLHSLLDNKNFPTLQDGVMHVRTLIAAYASSEKDGIDIQNQNDLYKERIFPWA